MTFISLTKKRDNMDITIAVDSIVMISTEYLDVNSLEKGTKITLGTGADTWDMFVVQSHSEVLSLLPEDGLR